MCEERIEVTRYSQAHKPWDVDIFGMHIVAEVLSV